MTKEQIYDAELSPLMQQIIAVCKQHGIAMIASFSIPIEEGDGYVCTTHLPDGNGEVFPKFLDAFRHIRQGGSTAFAITIGPRLTTPAPKERMKDETNTQ